MLIKKHFIFMSVLFLSIICFTQTTGIIRGHLKDEYGKIVKYGSVKIEGTNLESKADSNGFYQIIGAEPGHKKLLFWAAGYRPIGSAALVVAGLVTYADANNFVYGDLSQMHYYYEVTQVPHSTTSRIDYDMDFYKQTGIMKRLIIKSNVDCPTLVNKQNYKLKQSCGGL